MGLSAFRIEIGRSFFGHVSYETTGVVS